MAFARSTEKTAGSLGEVCWGPLRLEGEDRLAEPVPGYFGNAEEKASQPGTIRRRYNGTGESTLPSS